MKKHKKMKQTKRILTMVLASAILSTLVPPSFIETVHAAVIQETQEEEPWYQIKGKINSSWGGHIAGEIIITNSSNVSVQGWQIDFPWDAKITSMWNGICQQIGNWYLISPMDYNTTLAAGDSVTIGFLAEGEEKDLQLLEKENYFQQTGTKVTSEEERSQAGDTKPEATETPGLVPTPELVAKEGPAAAVATEEPVILIETPEVTEPPINSIQPPKTPEPAVTCAETGTPDCVETSGIPADTPERTGIPGTDIPAASLAKQPEIPTNIPVRTPEPGPALMPEVTSTPLPEVSDTTVPATTSAVTESWVPAATPVITDTPDPTPGPAQDLVIYTNTTLYEDIICADLRILGGNLDLNGHTITVQKDMTQAGGSCRVSTGSLQIAGNASISYGTLDLGSICVIQGDLSLLGTGTLRMERADTRLEVQGDVSIRSGAASVLKNGEFKLMGNLMQDSKSHETGLNAGNSFQFCFAGKKEQTVDLAYPDTSSLGKLDLRESAGVRFLQKVTSYNIAGLSQVTNQNLLRLEVYSMSLAQDEQTSCDVELQTGTYTLDGHTWEINGNLTIRNGYQKSLTLRNGNLIVSGDLSLEDTKLSLYTGSVTVGGSLNIGENGILNMTLGSGKFTIHGNMDIHSVLPSNFEAGILELGGNLVQHQDASENSFRAKRAFQITLNGETEQTIDLAYPETDYLGTLDIRDSAGVKILPKIRANNLKGLSRITNQNLLQLEINSLSLEQDEQTGCDVELQTGTYTLDGHTWEINGNLTIRNGYQKSLTLRNGNLIVSGDLSLEDTKLSLYTGSVTVGGNLNIGENGILNMTLGSGKFTIHGNMDIHSVLPSNFEAGILELGGNLVQHQDASENSFQAKRAFQITLNGEKEQIIDLAYPETDYLGTLDIRDSAGVKIPQKVRADNLKGLSRITNQNLLKLEIHSLSLEQDEQTGCDVELQIGTYSLDNYTWRINGNLTIYNGNQKNITLRNGNLKVSGNLFLEDTNLFLYTGSITVGGNLNIGENGILKMTLDSGKLTVHGNMDIHSVQPSTFQAGTLELGGDLVQHAGASEDSFQPSHSLNIILNGEREQTVDLNYDVSLGCLDISQSRGVYFAWEEASGYQLKGLERVTNPDYFGACFRSLSLDGDGVLDCDLDYTGKLELEEHDLTIRGDLYQSGELSMTAGKLEITGDHIVENGLSLGSGTVQVHGDMKLRKEAVLYMSEAESRLKVDGDIRTSSERSEKGLLTAGTIELKGDLVQTRSGESENLYQDGTCLLFTGKKEQKVTLKAGASTSSCFTSLDLTRSAGVKFTEGSLRAKGLRGWDKITNKVLTLTDSRFTLEQDEHFHGELTIYGELIHCNGHTFQVDKNLEQVNTLMNLDRGALKVGGDYIMKGNSILQMIKGEDKVHVAGDYATSSTLSHATMLKEGRFELEGNFHQEGQPASFGASGNHTMVLCSQKKEKQLVHFDNKQQSHFARIEITGPGYRSLDTPFGIICGLTDSIILGMQDAAGELLSSPEELLAMAATAAGVELLAAAVPEAALVVTIVFLAVYAEHLADIALNDRSMYEKAREYAREFTLLFLTVQAMRCARNGITTIKNVFQNKADLLSILRRKGTTPAKEILENPTELEILMPETGAELFASYKGLLEEEAITAYEKKVTQYPLEKGRDLKSIIQKAAGKLERKLTKSELEKILRWQDEEVAEEIICDWLCGEGGTDVVTGIKLPQGISSETFSDASKLIKENIGDISDDIVVQGSRASGTAKPTSDIDIAVRVTPEKFDELIQKSFGTPNSGTAKERTMLHAIETGKIQAGEAGLRGLRKELEKIFGMEVDISIIEIDGPFDNPPFIPIE